MSDNKNQPESWMAAIIATLYFALAGWLLVIGEIANELILALGVLILSIMLAPALIDRRMQSAGGRSAQG